MNGISLGIVTFLVWITAKGRLPIYAGLLKSIDKAEPAGDNTAPATPANPSLKPLTTLPNLPDNFMQFKG